MKSECNSTIWSISRWRCKQSSLSAVLQWCTNTIIYENPNWRCCIIMEEQYTAVCSFQLRETGQTLCHEVGWSQILAFVGHGIQPKQQVSINKNQFKNLSLLSVQVSRLIWFPCICNSSLLQNLLCNAIDFKGSNSNIA